jgi:hypothetical protein
VVLPTLTEDAKADRCLFVMSILENFPKLRKAIAQHVKNEARRAISVLGHFRRASVQWGTGHFH